MGNNIGIELKITELSKKFSEVKVLKNLGLSIKKGEFIAIVGRSGCGKSTLLRLIAGLDQPSEGNILIDGKNVSGIHPDIRYLFQESRLLPWKRVIDNVIIGAGKDKSTAINSLDSVGLADRAGDWPHILSGGQKQRVALARALAGSPRLMLLDEPLGALDALTRIEMQQLIEKLWLEKKFSVILVTHDVSEAVTLADRVILIDNGEITMDMEISLSRPRIKNNDFTYFEKHILDRVMKIKDDEESLNVNSAYSI